MSLNFESYAITDQGKVREQNQDNYLSHDSENLWLVADGAGGHDDGHVASQIIVDCLSGYKSTGRLGSDVRTACALLRDANKQILDFARQQNKTSGSTASALITDKKNAVCIWSGDSPIYRFRNGCLTQLTQDHNRVEEFMRKGFSLSECEHIPHAQHLTQALGASSKLCLQTRYINLLPQDCLLICSDGVTGELSFLEMQEIAEQFYTSSKDLCETIISEVLHKEARDNVTVLAVTCNM